MKRKILSVLGVLMAVILSTSVLTACEKAPAEDENNGGSGESVEESRENGAQSSEETEDESFDYTGWQDFTEETDCRFPEISSHGEFFC